MSDTKWEGPHIKTIKQYIGPYTHQGALDVDTSQPECWNEIDLGANADYIIVDDALFPPSSASGSSNTGGITKLDYIGSNHGLNVNHTVSGPYYNNPADYASQGFSTQQGATELTATHPYWSHLSGGEEQSLSNAIMELYQLGLSAYGNTHLLQETIQNAVCEPIRPNKELKNDDFYNAFTRKKEDFAEDISGSNTIDSHLMVGDGPKNIIKIGDYLRETFIWLPDYRSFINGEVYTSASINYPSTESVDYDVYYAIGIDNYLTNNRQTNVDFCGSSYKKIISHITETLNQKLTSQNISYDERKFLDFVKGTNYYNENNNTLNTSNALYWFNANTTSENRNWETSNPYQFLKTFLGTAYEEYDSSNTMNGTPCAVLHELHNNSIDHQTIVLPSEEANVGYSREVIQIDGRKYQHINNNDVEIYPSGSSLSCLNMTVFDWIRKYDNSYSSQGLNVLLDQNTIDLLNNHFQTTYSEGKVVGSLTLAEVIYLTSLDATTHEYYIYRTTSEQKHINPMDTFRIYSYPLLPLTTSYLPLWHFRQKLQKSVNNTTGYPLFKTQSTTEYYTYKDSEDQSSMSVKETTQLSRGGLFYWPLTTYEIFNRKLKNEKGLFDENKLFLQYPFFNNSKNIMRIMQQLTSDNWALCADTTNNEILVYNKNNGFGTIPLDSTDWDMPLCFRYGTEVGENQMHHLYPEFSVEQNIWMDSCYNKLI